jgi:Flp pilus assembly protein TadD
MKHAARRRRVSRIGARAFGATTLAALSALSYGCGSSGVGVRLEDDLRTEIRQRIPDDGAVRIPFRLTPQMREWVRTEVPRTKNDEMQLYWLLQEVLSRKDPEIRYVPGYTGTAEEVFASGEANCLAFTQLFIGMARELDLPVYFLRVSDLQSFEREGDLIVASVHITAAFGPAVSRRIIDFAERPVNTYRWVEPISDLTAVALYYSNRGAEELREGNNGAGRELLLTATRLDPELAEAWVNLGVAERRLGNLAGAEAAYRRALEVDSSTVTAYQNLAGLLRHRGRAAEAEELLALTDRSGNRNPFSYLALGDLALRQGRVDEAQRFFRRAVRLDPTMAESHAALGDCALRAGHRREAEKFLRKAEKLDPANRRVELLSISLRSERNSGGL